MNKSYKFLVGLSSLVFINLSSSCSNPNLPTIFGCASTTTSPSVSISTLSSLPEKVEIDGNEFELEIPYDISRSDNSGTINAFPLIPNIRHDECIKLSMNIISKSNNKRLPISYKVEQFWLINGQRAWERDLNFDLQNTINITGGPNWSNEGIYGVIKVSNGKGKTFFIKSKPAIFIG